MRASFIDLTAKKNIKYIRYINRTKNIKYIRYSNRTLAKVNADQKRFLDELDKEFFKIIGERNESLVY